MDLSSFDIKKDLSINQYALDKECVTHAVTFYTYLDLSIKAKSKVIELADLLKVTLAKTQLAVRDALAKSNAKATEGMIGALVDKEPEIVKIREKLRKAEEESMTLQAMVQALDHRKSQLDNLVKLHATGYFAAPAEAKNMAVKLQDKASQSIRAKLKEELQNDRQE